jgi:hypothetical protein
MAHRLENIIIKLNWPRDKQCGVFRLTRHLFGSGILFLDLFRSSEFSSRSAFCGVRCVDGKLGKSRIEVSRYGGQSFVCVRRQLEEGCRCGGVDSSNKKTEGSQCDVIGSREGKEVKS